MIELIIYYIEHLFTSFMGPVFLCLSGRFNPLTYVNWPLPVCGFHIFCAYMRYVLTPLSRLTWANLNHTLCGVGNDPFYSGFDLGHTYYFWADFYLLGGCYVTLIVNYMICLVFKTVFGCFISTQIEKNEKFKKWSLRKRQLILLKRHARFDFLFKNFSDDMLLFFFEKKT